MKDGDAQYDVWWSGEISRQGHRSLSSYIGNSTLTAESTDRVLRFARAELGHVPNPYPYKGQLRPTKDKR